MASVIWIQYWRSKNSVFWNTDIHSRSIPISTTFVIQCGHRGCGHRRFLPNIKICCLIHRDRGWQLRWGKMRGGRRSVTNDSADILGPETHTNTVAHFRKTTLWNTKDIALRRQAITIYNANVSWYNLPQYDITYDAGMKEMTCSPFNYRSPSIVHMQGKSLCSISIPAITSLHIVHDTSYVPIILLVFNESKSK